MRADFLSTRIVTFKAMMVDSGFYMRVILECFRRLGSRVLSRIYLEQNIGFPHCKVQRTEGLHYLPCSYSSGLLSLPESLTPSVASTNDLMGSKPGGVSLWWQDVLEATLLSWQVLMCI